MNALPEKAISPRWKTAIWIASIAVPLVVGVLLNPQFPQVALGFDTYILPKINATINSLVALALVLGIIFIRSKKILNHRIAMSSAFALSALFLVTYVLYHISTPSTSWCPESPVSKPIYFFILFSHIGLSVTIIPLSAFSIFRALRLDIERHKRLARITFPLWLYVAITGVLVYFLISPCYPV